MNIASNILRYDLLEQVIIADLEGEVNIPGFERVSVVRENNTLTWKFTSTFACPRTVDLYVGYWKAVTLILPSIEFWPGDQLNLTYTLRWWWEGDDKVRRAEPSPGARLEFQFCMVA